MYDCRVSVCLPCMSRQYLQTLQFGLIQFSHKPQRFRLKRGGTPPPPPRFASRRLASCGRIFFFRFLNALFDIWAEWGVRRMGRRGVASSRRSFSSRRVTRLSTSASKCMSLRGYLKGGGGGGVVGGEGEGVGEGWSWGQGYL